MSFADELRAIVRDELRALKDELAAALRQGELAAALHVSARRVARFIAKGMPAIGTRLFDPEEVERFAADRARRAP